MKESNLPAIAAELNKRAKGHPIGELQEIRKKLKKLHRRPGNDIFGLQGRSKTVFPKWAFHYGGRTELQFNIGEDGSDGAMLRHGVAFSFAPNQTLPKIDVLEPKVRLFNDFLQLYPEKYATMRMWHWVGDKTRVGDYMPSPIPPERVKKGVFVFLGKLLPIDQLNCDSILNDFDELLPLYLYVESGGKLQPISLPTEKAFSFRPGCSVKTKATVAAPKLSRVFLTSLYVTMRCRRPFMSSLHPNSAPTTWALNSQAASVRA